MLGIGFGDMVSWRLKPALRPLGKLDPLWDDGVYLGVRGKSGEIIIGNKKGVRKTRTVRRKPIEDRWTSSAPECVVGVPWRVSDKDPKVEDTAEGQRVRRESHDRERCKEGEEDGDGGDDG